MYHWKEVTMNFTVKLSDEEMSILLQALSHFMWNNPQITMEKFELAETVQDKLAEAIEG